ncbi:Exonuclease VII, large subunit [Flaviramulus basaltis]|uniref:Exonuclease VII, large subunit n=1 Tax=Flaviramulus basaltis TaxID=369401 RepID=A0A1K2IPP9_9FLAO|nr:exodeoxyribonuclease VII large subunit [Flaviramulus basaltis]SFZ94421.1 Exonuclease VII, large subunit [Flaviramulus basaltis]
MTKDNMSMSVSTLLTLYPNSLTSSLDGQLILLEGFYSDNKGKLYSKFFYDEFIDQNKQNKITIQLTEDLKSKLKHSSYYNIQGYISKGQSLDNDSRLKVFFRATKILELKADIQKVTKVEYDIIRARFDREFPIIQDILLKKIEREEKPTLDIITGIQSTSHDDYMNQLYDIDYYNVRHHKCNLSSKTEIIEFLSSYNFADSDLLIILRGGGSGLEIFDEIELCKRAIGLPIPFITGIGHDEDKTLLQRVSDMGFSTPTAVGVFLQKIISSYKERLRLIAIKDLEMERFKKLVDSEKHLLETRIKTQKNYLRITWLVIALFIIIIGVFICNLIFKKS